MYASAFECLEAEYGSMNETYVVIGQQAATTGETHTVCYTVDGRNHEPVGRWFLQYH